MLLHNGRVLVLLGETPNNAFEPFVWDSLALATFNVAVVSGTRSVFDSLLNCCGWLMSPSLPPNKRAPKQLLRMRLLSVKRAECRAFCVLLFPFKFVDDDWITLSRTIELHDCALYSRPRWKMPGNGMQIFLCTWMEWLGNV